MTGLCIQEGWIKLFDKVYLRVNPQFKMPYLAQNVVIFNDHLIVEFSSYELKNKSGEDPYRNIWCFSFDGDVIWKIQRPFYPHPDFPDDLEKATYNAEVPYNGLMVHEKTGEVVVWAHMRFTICTDDGTIGNPVQIK